MATISNSDDAENWQGCTAPAPDHTIDKASLTNPIPSDNVEFQAGIMILMSRSLAVSITLLAITPTESVDWQYERGPDRDDISSEPSGWNGMTRIKGELWKASVDRGSTSPLIVDGRVYLAG